MDNARKRRSQDEKFEEERGTAGRQPDRFRRVGHDLAQKVSILMGGKASLQNLSVGKTSLGTRRVDGAVCTVCDRNQK